MAIAQNRGQPDSKQDFDFIGKNMGWDEAMMDRYCK